MSVSGDECVSSRVEDFDDASSESTVRLRLVQDSPATSDCTRTPPPWIGTNDLEELETPTWELPVQHHHDAHVRGISSQVACRQIQPLANDVAMKHASAGSIQPAWVIRADDHVMGGGHVTGQSTINVSRRSRPTSASSSTSSAGSPHITRCLILIRNYYAPITTKFHVHDLWPFHGMSTAYHCG